MPSSFDAKLHIVLDNPSYVVLAISTEITIPEDPEDIYLAPLAWTQFAGMSNVKKLYYHGKVEVTALYPVIGQVSSVIQSMPGSGRGQMRFFDALVGPRIAELRLVESRRMRKAREIEDTINLAVTREEIARINELIEGFFESGEEGDIIALAQLANASS